MTMKLKPCPKCGGEIELYSCTKPDIPYQCFARCQKCKIEYPMPDVKLKSYGVKIYRDSIKKAERAWNEKDVK